MRPAPETGSGASSALDPMTRKTNDAQVILSAVSPGVRRWSQGAGGTFAGIDETKISENAPAAITRTRSLFSLYFFLSKPSAAGGFRMVAGFADRLVAELSRSFLAAAVAGFRRCLFHHSAKMTS